MPGTSKRARKTRVASDFDLMRIAAELMAPKVSSGYLAPSIEDIRAARDHQMLGRFRLPARLAQASRSDYAIYSAFLNRLAPQAGIPVKLEAANDTARAVRIRDEGDALFGPKGIGIKPDTLRDIDGCLADHGVAFGYNVVTPRPDGSRVDFELKTWPIEFVWWDPARRAFRTQVQAGPEETICHGDGRWVVFQQNELEPWKYGAVLATLPLWGDHGFGILNRSRNATSHGNAALLGELPEGIPLSDKDGKATPEAAALLAVLRNIIEAKGSVGVKPAGSKVETVVNESNAWQIFKEIVDSGDKAADRIYLGTPANAPAAGGDSVGFIFGVRDDIVEGALGAIRRGIREGVIEPWCAVNFGDSTLAPDRVYQMPDSDQDARLKSVADRNTAFWGVLKLASDAHIALDPAYIAQLAASFEIDVPKLKDASPTPTAGAVPPGSPPNPAPTQQPAPAAAPSLRAVP